MPQCHPQQWYTKELYKSWLHVLLQLPCLQGKHLRTSSEEEKMPFIIVSRCKHSLVTCAFVKCLSHRHYAFKQHWNGLRCSNHATKWNSLWKCSSLPISKCYTLLKFSITSDFWLQFPVHCLILCISAHSFSSSLQNFAAKQWVWDSQESGQDGSVLCRTSSGLMSVEQNLITWSS